MAIQLIADSCCDTSPALRQALGITLVPLTIIPATNIAFIDDEKIDLGALLGEMKKTKEPTRTACPSVEAYAEAMRQCDECIVVTLSSKLSGSYNAARLARQIVLEESPEKRIYVADSKSAAVAETLIALHAHNEIERGADYPAAVQSVTEYIAQMHTLFVLEDLSNLVKNGRMSKVEGLVASVMSLRPVLADDGEGEIKKLKILRGHQNALNYMVCAVAELLADRPVKSTVLGISYCNCLGRAERLRLDLIEKCPALREVILVPTAGISTVYANDGGIVIAF